VSVPLEDVKLLKAIESTLHVEVRGHVCNVRIVAKAANDMFYVRMPVAVWREFCRRRLAMPPPLPKGDQS
jgi:hypothetical protein